MMKLFSDLVNAKKIGRVILHPIPIPDLSNEAL